MRPEKRRKFTTCKKENIINLVKIDSGYLLDTHTKDGDIIGQPVDECSNEFLEKAYDAIKLLAKRSLNPIDGQPSADLVYIENMCPLCQLFFWAIKSLQKNGEISKSIKIITLSVDNDYGAYRSDGKFSLENQKKINNRSDAIEVNNCTFDIKTPGIYDFEELSNVFGSTIYITSFIQYDEKKDAFEVSY